MLQGQCPTCHLGVLHSRRATYAAWFREQFVVIPGLIHWQCDVCSETHYDQQVLERVHMLLGSEATNHGRHVESEYRSRSVSGRSWLQRKWST
jgi:YgiT-type zinc finger domain-containing protein